MNHPTNRDTATTRAAVHPSGAATPAPAETAVPSPVKWAQRLMGCWVVLDVLHAIFALLASAAFWRFGADTGAEGIESSSVLQRSAIALVLLGLMYIVDAALEARLCVALGSAPRRIARLLVTALPVVDAVITTIISAGVDHHAPFSTGLVLPSLGYLLAMALLWGPESSRRYFGDHPPAPAHRQLTPTLFLPSTPRPVRASAVPGPAGAMPRPIATPRGAPNTAAMPPHSALRPSRPVRPMQPVPALPAQRTTHRLDAPTVRIATSVRSTRPATDARPRTPGSMTNSMTNSMTKMPNPARSPAGRHSSAR